MSNKYVAIMVHEDVYYDAVDALNELADELGYDDDVNRRLRDLIDPLPEPDTNGVTPFVFYDPEQPITAERAKLLAEGLLGLKV